MKKLTLLSATLLMPFMAFAQSGGDDFSSLQKALESLQDIISWLVPFLIGLAVIVLLFGIVQWIFSGGDPDKRKEGGRKILVGIVGIFIMVSIYGLVNVLGDTFNLDNTLDDNIPELPDLDGDF